MTITKAMGLLWANLGPSAPHATRSGTRQDFDKGLEIRRTSCMNEHL